MSEEILRIANCSGYYGDRLSAAREMVDGGPIDVLTGDYLAELTMAILFNQKLKRGEDKGYVGTFLKQLQDVASTCKDKNIKIVTNAGGLNPQSMTNEIRQILNELNIDMKVAYIEGDNLMSRIEELQKNGEEFTNIDISKQFQNSDFGGDLTAAQLKYCANDVIYLHKIHEELIKILDRESRLQLYKDCLKFLKTRVELDLALFKDDIWAH